MDTQDNKKIDEQKAPCSCGNNEQFAHKKGEQGQVRDFTSQEKTFRELKPMGTSQETSSCCSKEEPEQASGCGCGTSQKPKKVHKPFNRNEYFIKAALAFIVWYIAYNMTIPFADFVTYTLLGLEATTALAKSIHFFLYDTLKILLLLVFMVYVLALFRASLSTDKVRLYLAGKGRGVGYAIASAFGAVTPFCSCSSIPLFIGFTNSKIPLGITMSFLITSPLINEVAVILLWGLLGWKFTIIYVVVGMLAGIIGGFIIDMLKADRWLQPFLKKPALTPLSPMGVAVETKMTLEHRHRFAYEETEGIVRKIWLWVFIGVGIGAYLHGFVPQEWFEQNLNSGDWWSVPVAVVAGIPLYTSVTGIVPIMESLLLKGLPVGTTLAFCMSAVGASLPEILMLKQVMQFKLLATFVAILLVIFVCVGWIFNTAEVLLF